MCRPDDYPPHPQTRQYSVTYYTDAMLRTTTAQVWADNADEARAKAKAQDPRYIATSKSPRIVR